MGIPDLNSPTVFLIDDSPDMQALFEIVAELSNFKLIYARNGLEALEMVDHLSRNVVVFLDLTMPVMDGKQFLAELEQRRPDFSHPIILMSGREDAGVQSRLITGRLTKPFSNNDLEKCLKQHLGSRTVGPEQSV